MAAWLDRPGPRALALAYLVVLSFVLVADATSGGARAVAVAAWWAALVLTLVSWVRWGMRRQRQSLAHALLQHPTVDDIPRRVAAGVVLGVPLVAAACVGLIVAFVVMLLPYSLSPAARDPSPFTAPIAWLGGFIAVWCAATFVTAALVRWYRRPR